MARLLDYLSVPQWKKDMQRQLLLSIPAIYSYPESISMHLDDVGARLLNQVHEDRAYNSFIEGLTSIIRSRWFDRMWVTLEYIKSKEVLVLSKEYEISKFNADHFVIKIENASAKYVKRMGHGNFMQDVVSHGSGWPRFVSWTMMQS